MQALPAIFGFSGSKNVYLSLSALYSNSISKKLLSLLSSLG
jgi:hypothetical protein